MLKIKTKSMTKMTMTIVISNLKTPAAKEKSKLLAQKELVYWCHNSAVAMEKLQDIKVYKLMLQLRRFLGLLELEMKLI